MNKGLSKQIQSQQDFTEALNFFRNSSFPCSSSSSVVPMQGDELDWIMVCNVYHPVGYYIFVITNHNIFEG